MIERVVVSNKQASPPLGQRIVTALDNPNASAAELSELMAETELALAAADQTAADERKAALDLARSPDPKAAHDRIVGSELVRDQFKTVLPKLRDKLTAALESERHARWLSTYRNAKTERDALAEEIASTYPTIVAQLVDLFNRMQQCDQKCAKVNSTASTLVGEHRRLVKTELRARGLEAFSIYRPEIAQMVVLPDFVESARMRWPVQTSFAAACAEIMTVPSHPGAAWCEPDVQAQRRAEKEKQNREMGEHYQRMTAEQEDRINGEERERMTTSRRAT